MATAQPEPHREAYRQMFQAAAPLGRLTTGYDAEVATSVLLGAVYARSSPIGRRETVTGFVDEFVKFLGRRRTGEAWAVLAGLAAVAPGAARERAARTVQRFAEHGLTGPPWIDQVGNVRCTGGWQVRDQYGDQTHYLVTYDYDSPLVGGPEHAVGVLVDHNRRLVTDLLVHYSAEETLAGWRQAAEGTSGHVTVEPVEPALVRTGSEQPLRRTEELPEPPGGQRYLNNWAFTLARLTLLPAAGEPTSQPVDTSALVRDFLESSDARRVMREMTPSVTDAAEVVGYGVGLAVAYAADANSGDPLRWSPTAASEMLLEWAPTRRGLPPDAVAWLPEVLDAFVRYAADVRDLSEPATLATRLAIARASREYPGRMLGEPGGEPMDVVLERMVADGVDPTDEAASRRWLTAYLEQRAQVTE
ncbi:MAG TPA: hypothetical protein VFZ32_04970 [Micromonosporaceae bacterium]